MDKDKLLYLEQNGYKPITNGIISKYLKGFFGLDPEFAEKKEAEVRKIFAYYKRYGNDIMPYSLEYLEQTSIDELKQNAIKTEQRFL